MVRAGFLDNGWPFAKSHRLMAEPKVNELMEKIVSLCKRRGFIYQSSEIYGGINGFWITARSVRNSNATSRNNGGAA